MHTISTMSAGLQGSQILALAEEIRQKIRGGEEIFNLTIGDFNPELFPIPSDLEQEIQKAYSARATNYPNSNGIPELREAVADFTREREGLDYDPGAFLMASGARPLIYSAYVTVADPGDKLIYPLPSWNNNYYTHIVQGAEVAVETRAEDNFLPTADLLRPHIRDAALIALCSPLNPTGTVFGKEQLMGICEMILEENRRRGPGQKPLYLIYDQIYWNLTYGDTIHYNPVSLFPEMKPYTIFIDGMSKAFAATGLRIGWGFGPQEVIQKMKLLLAHIGAWPARPVQTAAAHFLRKEGAVNDYLAQIRGDLSARLNGFYERFQQLKQKGFPVDAISPQAALYLTVKLDLADWQTPQGKSLANGKDVYSYLLNEAGLAIVPFYAFGLEETSPWHRLSVGTARMEDIPVIFDRLEMALRKLERVGIKR